MARNYHIFDLVILGGGPAGRAALREALQITQNVVLISPQACESSHGEYEPALLSHLWQISACRRHGGLWAETRLPEAHALWKEVQEESARLRAAKEALLLPFLHYGIKGRARFASPLSVRVDDGRLLHFSSAIIATGIEGVESRLPEKMWKILARQEPLVMDAQFPEQVSLGVLCAMLGADVEIRGSFSGFDISWESFSHWKSRLPDSCIWREEKAEEKNRFSRLPAGLGLRAAGISKAVWLEREQKEGFHIGASPIYVAGTARGEGKDSFACMEEGRQAARAALLSEQGAAAPPERQFTLYGPLSLAVYGTALQNLPENAEERVIQPAFFTGGQKDFYLKLWQDRQNSRPLRVEIWADDPFFPLHCIKEWMRSGKRPVISGEWLEKYPLLRAL